MKAHVYAVTALAGVARAQLVPRPRESDQRVWFISEVANDGEGEVSMSLSMAADYQFVDFLKWGKSSKTGAKSSKTTKGKGNKRDENWRKPFFSTTSSTTSATTGSTTGSTTSATTSTAMTTTTTTSATTGSTTGSTTSATTSTAMTTTTTSTCAPYAGFCTTAADCCEECPLVSPVVCCVGDNDPIGVCGAPNECRRGFCRRRLRDGEEDPVKEDLPHHEVLDLIKANEPLGARPDATFSFMYDLISKKSCDTLIDHLESSLASDIASGVNLPVGTASDQLMEENEESWLGFEDGGVDNEYSKKLYADELLELIGQEETLKIIEFFEESLGSDLNIDCMYISRHGDPKDDRYMVPWHMDDYATVEITLNKDYDGGHVLHVNADGVHKTEARPGSATAHSNDILHGITPNIGGAKYMLILKHHFNRPDKEGVVRLSREIVDELTNGQLRDIATM